jgi:hypothetical protein
LSPSPFPQNALTEAGIPIEIPRGADIHSSRVQQDYEEFKQPDANNDGKISKREVRPDGGDNTRSLTPAGGRGARNGWWWALHALGSAEPTSYLEPQGPEGKEDYLKKLLPEDLTRARWCCAWQFDHYMRQYLQANPEYTIHDYPSFEEFDTDRSVRIRSLGCIL